MLFYFIFTDCKCPWQQNVHLTTFPEFMDGWGWSVRVMLGNWLFLSNIYLFIHSAMWIVSLKSYSVLHTTEDTDVRKINCPGVVYSVLFSNDTYINTLRQNICISFHTCHKMLGKSCSGLFLNDQWQKPNFNLSKKGIIIFFKGKYLFKIFLLKGNRKLLIASCNW